MNSSTITIAGIMNKGKVPRITLQDDCIYGAVLSSQIHNHNEYKFTELNYRTELYYQYGISEETNFKDSIVKCNTFKLLSQNNKEETITEAFLTCRSTDNIILDYLFYDQEENSENNVSSIYGNNFFKRVENCQVILLLRHVVRGEQKKADAILQQNLYLLFETGRVTDYTCTEDGVYYRKLEGTAYRLALGAKDVKFHSDEECMVEMIMRHFRRLPHWEVEIKKQYDDQFPPEWEHKEEQRKTNDLLALHKVLTAINEVKLPDIDYYKNKTCYNNGMQVLKTNLGKYYNWRDEAYKDCEKACEPALKEFRKYLDDQIKENVIKTGFHFNDNLLQQAFHFYNKNIRAFGANAGSPWESPKNILCWRKIIGYIERFVPVCTAQAFCMGLVNYVDSDKELERSLKFKEGYSYFPLLPNAGLGFEWSASGYLTSATPGCDMGFSKLILNKNKTIIQTLYHVPETHMQAENKLEQYQKI